MIQSYKKILWSVLLVFLLSLFVKPSISYARDNAYVCCVFDETSMSYVTMVLYSGTEIEKNYFCYPFFEDPDDIKNIDITICGDGITVPKATSNSKQKTFKITSSGFEGPEEVDGYSTGITGAIMYPWVTRKLDQVSADAVMFAPLTFPANTNNATQADINRAYAVADELGGDLTNALLFLNDGKLYSEVGAELYFKQMRYYLLSIEDEGYVINTYGSKYHIKYNDDKCVITYMGRYTKQVEQDGGSFLAFLEDITGASVTTKWENFDAASGSEKISEEFTCKMEKGYVNRSKNFKGTEMQNNLSSHEDYSKDVEELSWYHLVLEAEVLYASGISYNNYEDLYDLSQTELSVVGVFRSLLTGAKTALGCYSIDDLVFNKGVFGSSAYLYGLFPQTWLNGIGAFFVIMAVLAYSVLSIAVILLVGRNGLTEHSSVGARYTLMTGFKDIVMSAVLVAFAIPVLLIALHLINLGVDVFAAIADASGKTFEQVCPATSYGTLAGVIIAFAYFVIDCYINVIYLLRRVIMMGLVATSPIFIILFAFGPKCKMIANKWLQEVIGNLMLQPIHAMILAFIMTACTGLRGIESITLVASIIPITNMYKQLVSEGGNLAGKLAARATTAGVGLGASAIGSAAEIGGAATFGSTGAMLQGAGRSVDSHAMQTIGRTMEGVGQIGSGVVSGAVNTVMGTGLSLGLGGEDNGVGINMARQGMSHGAREVSMGVKNVGAMNAMGFALAHDIMGMSSRADAKADRNNPKASPHAMSASHMPFNGDMFAGNDDIFTSNDFSHPVSPFGEAIQMGQLSNGDMFSVNPCNLGTWESMTKEENKQPSEFNNPSISGVIRREGGIQGANFDRLKELEHQMQMIPAAKHEFKETMANMGYSHFHAISENQAEVRVSTKSLDTHPIKDVEINHGNLQFIYQQENL